MMVMLLVVIVFVDVQEGISNLRYTFVMEPFAVILSVRTGVSAASHDA